MMSLRSRPVTFKEVWTTHICQFHVNPFWTISQFIQSIKPHLSREFNTSNFDIVEAGQNAGNLPSEAAPALIESNIQLINKWGPEVRVAFYIRRIDYEYPQLQNLNIR
jgi:hypothetical protein